MAEPATGSNFGPCSVAPGAVVERVNNCVRANVFRGSQLQIGDISFEIKIA